MNWGQFEDPASHMCLAGTVVASWSLTHEVAGSSPFKQECIPVGCLPPAAVAIGGDLPQCKVICLHIQPN